MKSGGRKGRNGERKAVKIWKEAAGPFLPFLDPQIWRDSVFYAVQSPFLTLCKPVLAPFVSRPWFYCTAYLSYLDTRHFEPNHWTTSDHHWSIGPVGRLYSWKGDLGTSLHNMFSPAFGSKQSGSIMKARPLGAPHTKNKIRLNEPDERRGRGGGGDTQLQAPTVARHSQGQQE